MIKFLLLISVIIINGCSSERIQVDISRKITNPKIQTVSIISDTTIYKDRLNNREFSYVTTSCKSTYVEFMHANESTQLHISPSNIIHVSLNSKQFDEILL
jgi:hypothetical protein